MTIYFGEQIQANDRNKRRRRSFVDQGMIETVSAEQEHSRYSPNPLPLSSSSQSSFPMPLQNICPPRANMTPDESNSTPKRLGKRKADSNVVSPPAHVMAQRLNNQAVKHIHCRQYEEAISNLAAAIKLSQSAEFLPIPHSNPLSVILKHHFGNSSSSPSVTVISTGDIDERDDINTKSETQVSDTMDTEFIYSRGIMVPSESQAHATGQTFHVILFFNLALAHHLSWTARKDTSNAKRLNDIVQLYEIAYRLALGIPADRMENEISPDSCSDLCNMRFTLAIINNLAQIHRALNDDHHDRHGVLEDLLSHLMVVATVQQHHSSFNSERGNPPGLAGLDEMEATNTEINLDGFFLNVLPLVLKSNSAGAA